MRSRNIYLNSPTAFLHQRDCQHLPKMKMINPKKQRHLRLLKTQKKQNRMKVRT